MDRDYEEDLSVEDREWRELTRSGHFDASSMLDFSEPDPDPATLPDSWPPTPEQAARLANIYETEAQWYWGLAGGKPVEERVKTAAYELKQAGLPVTVGLLPPSGPESEYLTTKEAAAYLKMKLNTFYKVATKIIRCPGNKRFLRKDLDEFALTLPKKKGTKAIAQKRRNA